ncbi:MAG: hypothetical protein HQ541_07225 [Mariniphaga sp.]|nr:hypothetical protein [Mariniphaga sp.]
MSGNITTDGNVTAAYFSGDGSLLTNIVSYISKWATGNFNGSLYTTGADSTLSDSNSLFQIISDTRGTPQFQIQDGGANQASFIARSFMIVKQNNTLLNMSQNNICSDWGFNHIDCNTGTTGADFGVDDDIEAQNLIWSGGGFRAAVERQSAFFIATDNITAKYSGATGSYDPSTYYFCDYTDSNFEDT